MAGAPIAQAVLPVTRAEDLRSDQTTYFSILPKDLTDILDQMAHPLSTRLLRLIREINLPISGLSRGINLISRTMETTTNAEEEEVMENKVRHYSLPDCTLLLTHTTSLDTTIFDLRGADDRWPVYCDGHILYIKHDQYGIREGPNGIICFNLAEEEQAPKGPDLFFYSDLMGRGNQGWIYFLAKYVDNHLYRLNLRNPTKVECLTIPPVNGANLKVIAFRSALKVNILMLHLSDNSTYRWNLDTQEVSMIHFNGNIQSYDTYLDPLTGTIYYSNKYRDIYREDGEMIFSRLIFGKKSMVMNMLITLHGQVIITTSKEGKSFSYLYG